MIFAKTVTKNSLYSLSSSVVQKLLTLIYFILVARSFGPQEQGRYSAAIAFATLFGVLIDLGLSSALTRETARDTSSAKEFFGQMVIARISIGILVYGLIIGSALLLGYSSELVSMIAVAGIASVIDTITTSCWFLLRGFRNLLYESIGSVAAIVAMIGVGIGAIVLHLPVILLVYAVLFGSIVNACIALFTVLIRARIPLTLIPHAKTLRTLAVISLPFAGAALFSRIYTFADVTLLTKLAGEQAVGWYSAGNKLILALNVIPGALSASLYPALSSYFVSAPEKLSRLTARALYVLLLIAVPLGFGIAVTASPIILLFYGQEYFPSIPILQVLGMSVVFSFLSFPFGALLAATNRQGLNTIIFGIAACINVASNIILIPRLGALGSAWASAATMGTLVLLSLGATRTILVSQTVHLLSRAFRILCSAFVMAGLLWLMEFRGAPLGVLILIGVCVYGACTLLTKAVTLKELQEVRDALSRDKRYETR